MKYHSDFKKEVDEIKISQKLNDIREIRNDFVHNKKINDENVKRWNYSII